MTESQSTNPFLIGVGGFDSTTISNAAPEEYNPFNIGASSSFSSNPFLQSFGTVTTTTKSAETNPFAAFFNTEATSNNTFSSAIGATSDVTARPELDTGLHSLDTFSSMTASVTANTNVEKLPTPAPPTTSDSVSDLLGDFTEPLPVAPAAAPPPHSSVTDITHSINTSPVDKTERPPPRRPPPPRPMPPRESKELILSVTAALEQTSSDMLDRLQATRTPSPTPLRDLNSPSPTLLGEVNDLLIDQTEMPMPQLALHGENKHIKHDMQQEAISLFDAIANLSKDEEHRDKIAASDVPLSVPAPSPILMASEPPPVPPLTSSILDSKSSPPALPSRPPPPPLPIHCETDLSNLTWSSSTTQLPYQVPLADSHETPQISRKSSLNSTTSSRKSSLDFSGGTSGVSRLVPRDEAVVAKPPTEIMEENTNMKNSTLLYNKKEPLSTTNYVATRKASHDVTASRLQTIPMQKKYSLDYSSGFFPADQNVIKEKFEQYEIADQSDPSHDNKILEAPKFTVISTTPIMSYENINNEMLYQNEDKNETEKEPSLIFDEATEKVDPFAAFVQNENRPTPDPFVSYCGPGATQVSPDPFANEFTQPVSQVHSTDDFDTFQEKFDNVKQPTTADQFDPFSMSGVPTNNASEDFGATQGFGNEDTFDEFLAMNQPLPTFSADFNQNAQLSNQYVNEASWPPDANNQEYSQNTYDTCNTYIQPPTGLGDTFNAAISQKVAKTDSTETPPTPLFDEDISQPLLPFPRTNYTGPGWEMQIRYPIRKKFTGQRFWKKVFVRLVFQGDTPHLELINKDDGKETLHHEWPLQPCYAISDIGAQQYDQYGKIFTVKIQFVVYKERPGVRPGQVTKAERLTNKLSQFAAYAIQGDYQGVKEFGSDLKKLGLPVEHSPQISLICKLGSHNYEDMKQFSACVEDALFGLSAHRDNIHTNYKMEEVQITAVDELYVEQNSYGSIDKQIARVRLFFLGFLTGMPDVEIGVNDLWRQGKEVVGRHDIIPVVTEEWIRLENVEFHSCIQQNVYEETRTIKLKPPDACYLELMRFRVRPPKNRELPLQLKTVFKICGNKVDILADILVPGFTSRKLGQIPCEDVAVRIPIPECWIYLFRVEKHFRYGSVKSAHRRTGKIKGIERFLGAVDTLEQHLIEVTSGHAKYEHHHKSIVWRMSRLPKEGQGAYTTHNLICHLQLTSYDQVPDELAKYCYVEFTMPITQVSHTTVRSVSISNSDSDTPPEKYVRHLARHEYRVEIEKTHTESTSDYIAATMTKPTVTRTAAAPVQPLPPVDPEPASDSDSE